MSILLSLSVAVLAGLLMTRVAKPLKLPSVTAYLVAGVLIGPYCLGLLGIQGLGFPTMADVESLSLISDVALGFIAFPSAASSGCQSSKKPADRPLSSVFCRRWPQRFWLTLRLLSFA